MSTGTELRAVFYARVSTEEEKQLNALEKQIQENKDVIRDHGWRLVGEYIDATVIIGLKQNPTHGRRFSPVFFA